MYARGRILWGFSSFWSRDACIANIFSWMIDATIGFPTFKTVQMDHTIHTRDWIHNYTNGDGSWVQSQQWNRDNRQLNYLQFFTIFIEKNQQLGFMTPRVLLCTSSPPVGFICHCLFVKPFSHLF